MFRLEPQTLPLVAAMAIALYVAVQEFVRSRWVTQEPIHRYGSVLATIFALVLAGRLVQRISLDPWAAELGIRAQLAAALFLPFVAVAMTRAVWSGPYARRLLVGTGVVTASGAALVLFSPLFLRSGASLRSDALGATYFELPPGPAMFLLVPFALLALVACVRLLLGASSAGAAATGGAGTRPYAWIGLATLFALASINDLLVGAQVYDGVQLFEYASFVLTFEAGRLLVHRTAELQASLEGAVAERTTTLAAQTAELARALEQQRLGDARFRQLSEATIEGVVVHRDGRILDLNESLARLLGRDSSSMVGEPVSALFEATSAPDVVRLASGSATAANLRGAGGEPVPVEVVARTLPEGEAGVGVLAIRDVRELKALRTRVSRTERLAGIGTLAAGAAHEINNPLTYVVFNTVEAREVVEEVLRTGDRAPLEEVPALLFDVEDGCRRIEKVVRGLGELARERGDEVWRLVDVRQTLERALDVVMHQIRHRARIKRTFAAELPPVSADESRLGQVFINLLVNAAQAIPPGHVDSHEIEVVAETGADGDVVVEVRDTGTGIAPEHRARIFDPFFTTKPIGSGTGLGLAISHEIVEGLGGTIGADDRPCGGTVLRVALPAHRGQKAPLLSSRPPTARTVGAKVLVVDDEPLIARALGRALADYEVVLCGSGREALSECEKRSFDAIVCDLMMPDWTGMDLYEALAAKGEGAERCMVFASGGVFTERARSFVESRDIRVLSKPISVRELRQAVEAVLAARALRLSA